VYFAHPFFRGKIFTQNKLFMAKESMAKENPVVDALRKLKEEEAELVTKLKPLQEAISALEKIVEKTVKKTKPSSGTKDGAEEGGQESGEDAQ
jgi:histone deacetylase complex regulatory component SIN3